MDTTNTFKVSFYYIDPNGDVDTGDIESKISWTDGIFHQVHIEKSEPWVFEEDSPENMQNCDLADLEARFNHKPNGNLKLRPLAVGGIYRHFKGHHVKVLACSIGTEYGEKIVVYEHLGDHTIWHRPLEMFLSEVDREKYPDVEQKWRFELVDASEARFE